VSRAEPANIEFRLTPLSLDTEALKARLVADPRVAAGAIHGAARQGSAAAQLVYAQILLDGRGVAGDPVAALVWFQRAAEQSEPEAWNMIGRCHEKGWGTPQDYVRAIPYFERAITLGHVWAKVNLAQILMRLGNPADRPRAYSLFEEAANAGNLKAINSLARFLEEGWAGPADPQRAAALYGVAAERGDHWAQFNLATLLYAQGNAAEAMAWLDRWVAKSDDGFRGRIAEVLLRQPDHRLRRAGAAALARCAPHTDPSAAFALKPSRLARFKRVIGRTRLFKPPGPPPVSIQR